MKHSPTVASSALVALIMLSACTTTAGPGPAGVPVSVGAPPAGAPTLAASSSSVAASCSPGTPRPAAATLDIARILPSPAVPFTGTAGSPPITLAFVEALDVPTGRITVTYPRASTGGTTGGTVSRATVRVTASSVLEQVVTTTVPLTSTVEIGATTLALASGAPAVRAKTEVTLVGRDPCGQESRQIVTLAQAADAGASDWYLTAPVSRASPSGSTALIAEVKPLRLADLAAGDLLLAAGPIPVGLSFTGTPADYVVTRLLRSCKSEVCPLLAR